MSRSEVYITLTYFFLVLQQRNWKSWTVIVYVV